MSARKMRDPVETYREVKAELARRRFRDFIRQFWRVVEPARPLISSWHVDAIADHLQAISEGQIKNLLINVPPASQSRNVTPGSSLRAMACFRFLQPCASDGGRRFAPRALLQFDAPLA